MKEKRRSARVRANGVVSFSFKSVHSANAARIVDISEGGLCIASTEHLPVNAVVELEISSDLLREPLKTSARVVRIVNRSRGKFQYEVGLEFLDLSFANWNIIRDFIMRSMAQGYNQKNAATD
jgi:hypothetical protein